MTPFEAYQEYLALKQHFSSNSYDYIKYDGKVTVKQDTFEKRRDKYQFYKLSKKIDVTGYLVANFIHNHKLWVGDLNSPSCENNYRIWKSRQESLSYNFKNDLKKLDDDFNSNFKVINGQYPSIIRQYQFGEISLETIVILNKIINFLHHWDGKISDTIVWPELKKRIEKYTPFISFDEKKFKEIVKKRFI